VVNDAMGPCFQDAYDHVLRAAEWTESLRDVVTSVLETNLTIQGNRLNVITKMVTSWAAVIAVPTAITGFYASRLVIIACPGCCAYSSNARTGCKHSDTPAIVGASGERKAAGVLCGGPRWLPAQGAFPVSAG
jgi:hypothetical protein